MDQDYKSAFLFLLLCIYLLLTAPQPSYADIVRCRDSKKLVNGRYIPEVSTVWKTLPDDIFCSVLESAIEPKDGTNISLIDPVRLDTARKLCLINKSTAKWIEPLLYKSVALVTSRQVISFGYTLKNKSPEFLSQNVRALYIFYHDRNRILYKELRNINFPHLFKTLNRLEKLALRGNWCLRFCDTRASSSIIDLTLIEPSDTFERLYEHRLSLRSLHIINPNYEFSRSSSTYRDLHTSPLHSSTLGRKLNVIPRICLDFTYTDYHQPGQFVNVLGRTLKGAERFHVVPGSDTTIDTLGSSMDSYEQIGGPEEPLYSAFSKKDVQTESRFLWVKTSPFINRFWDTYMYGRRGPCMQSSSYVEANKRTWESVAAEYKRTGPSDRPACWESPLADDSESLRFQRLPRLERMKLAIHYNELHWDRIARWCESET